MRTYTCVNENAPVSAKFVSGLSNIAKFADSLFFTCLFFILCKYVSYNANGGTITFAKVGKPFLEYIRLRGVQIHQRYCTEAVIDIQTCEVQTGIDSRVCFANE